MEKKRIKRRYITGLDGLRSLAVLAVIFYHLIPTTMRGGYLGVPVIFAISGYLITDLLRQEWQQNGTIQLKQFYVRRIKRLYPALVVLLVTSSAYITLFQRNLLNNLRGVVTSSLLYVNNWWQINHGLSYFDRFGNESPFTHLWSLAVEGQNYLIWPLVFLFLMKFVKRREKIFLWIAGGALISAILMGILYTPGTDPTRVYYGTDTRIFAIWMGSSLAFIWPSTRLKETIPKQAQQVLNIIGGIALAILLVSFVFLNSQYTFVYYGGMYILTFFAIIFIAIVVHPGASWNRWLTNPVFTYLGKRSYGIYLYQFPVMIFYEAKVQTIANQMWLHIFIELALILIASELSYRFVETPLRKFDYGKLIEWIRKWWKQPVYSVGKIVGIISGIVFAISLIGLVIAPKDFVDANQADFQKELQENKKVAEQTKNEQPSSTTDETDSEKNGNDAELMATYNLTAEEANQARHLEVTAFGDSVMLGATQNLQEVFPNAVVDADIGRQLYGSNDEMTKLKHKKLLKDNVILGLGTNGPASEAQFDSLMQIIGDRHVYLINTRVPTQRWQNDVNQMLAQMAEKYDNITLIDWYNQSNSQDTWFKDDLVHLTEEGKVAYTSFIAKQLLEEK